MCVDGMRASLAATVLWHRLGDFKAPGGVGINSAINLFIDLLEVIGA